MARRRSQPRVAVLTAALRDAPRPWSRREIESVWSKDTLARAVRSGTVTRLAPGQYAHREWAGDFDCRVAVAHRWMGSTGHISGLAALRLWGWAAAPVERIAVAFPREVRLVRPAFIDSYRTAAGLQTGVVRGIPVIGAEDAAILVWRSTPERDRRGLMLELLRAAPVDPRVLLRRMDVHPRVPQRAALESLVRLALDGVASILEHLAATEVFVGPEWADWERQGTVAVGPVTLHPDMVHRGARLAVEFDGARFHSDDASRRRDLDRDGLLAEAGYTVIRFTWEDITRRPEMCRRRVRAALRSRSA